MRVQNRPILRGGDKYMTSLLYIAMDISGLLVEKGEIPARADKSLRNPAIIG